MIKYHDKMGWTGFAAAMIMLIIILLFWSTMTPHAAAAAVTGGGPASPDPVTQSIGYAALFFAGGIGATLLTGKNKSQGGNDLICMATRTRR